MRIGVIADTHCPEFLDQLPAAVFEKLRGVDLILHAGDVGGEQTLDRLRELAPVEAVRGDHDGKLGRLPLRRLVEVGGHRIAVVHGNRSRLLEEPITFVATLTLGLVWLRLGMGRWLRRQFPEADVIIYGHTHKACVEEVDGAVVFNPGAVYQVTRPEVRHRLDRRPNWFEWCWLQVIRHRMDRPVRSVGLLEIGDAVSATVVPLG
jgi:uncharacterized protein